MPSAGTNWVYAAVVALFAGVFLCASAQAQSDEAAKLNKCAIELYRAGKAGEAIPLAKRALELREKALPAGHTDIATSLNNLALFYKTQGRIRSHVGTDRRWKIFRRLLSRS